MKFEKFTQKDCLSQNRYIYEFNEKINDKFVKFLEIFGEVKVFTDFPIPFIKMDEPKKLRLTALMNSKSINIFFKKERSKNFVDEFEEKLKKLNIN